MGEIVGAGFLSHAPTIMFPQEIRYRLNEGREISLVPSLERLRSEVLDELQPDIFLGYFSGIFFWDIFLVCAARGRLFSDYENATGAGQVHVWFDKPVSGLFRVSAGSVKTPGEYNSCFLMKFSFELKLLTQIANLNC